MTTLPSQAIAGETPEKKLYEKNSLYQFISVVENTDKKERYVYTGSNRRQAHGGMSLENPEKLIFEYTRVAFVSLAFSDRDPEDVLFVGLGGGAMPKYFSRYYPEANIDIVEIDPEMIKISRKYFDFQERGNMKVHTADGRVFIKRARKKYDIIFLDAYQGNHIPFHLTTVEFLKEVRKKLKDGGIVVSNIMSESRNKFFYSMLRTYTEVFPHIYCYTRWTTSDNFIFVATVDKEKKESIHVWVRAKELETKKHFDIDIATINQDQYGYYTDYKRDAEILTDDFAPVNLYRHMEVEN
jgi:spermidine synthase